MEKQIANIEKDPALLELCEDLYNSHERFFERMRLIGLRELVEFKIFVGVKILKSPLFGKYGSNLLDVVSSETGMRATVLYDCVMMVQKEGIASPMSRKKFLSNFLKEYHSWNEYRAKAFGVQEDKKSTGGKLKDRCGHCPIHCK